MKKFLYFLLATAMLATFGCTGDENTYSVGSPNPNELMPKGTVQGILKDACTNEPIAGAVIDIGVAQATTSETGQYVMHNVPATSFVSPTALTLLSGYSGEYSATIDLRKAKNVVTGKNNYPQFSYSEVSVAFSSLAETSLAKAGIASNPNGAVAAGAVGSVSSVGDVSASVSTTNATNHDTPVTQLGNGDFDFYVGKITTSISGAAVTADMKNVPDGYAVLLYSLGNNWTGNSSTGAEGHLIAQTTTKNGRFTFDKLEAKQFFRVVVVDTADGVATMTGQEIKRTNCEGTTWFGVQDGDPIIVRSTDVLCPFITKVSPSNWADLDPATSGGIKVVFTFSEPIKANAHITGRGLTASDLGGLYSLVYVYYEGNKAGFNKSGNIAHSLAWNDDMTELTVTINPVGKASVYSVSLGDGAQALLKDAAGNELSAGLGAHNTPCVPFRDADFVFAGETVKANIFTDKHNVPVLKDKKLIKQVHFTTYGASAAGQPALKLTATPYDFDDNIQFSWTAATGAKYYNLYCATNQVWSNGSNVHTTAKVNANPITDTTFAYDPQAVPQFNFVENNSIKLTYDCYVVGVDADGIEGKSSNIVTASDKVAPRIIGSTLAAAIQAKADFFTISFSEPMVKSVVQDPANYTLNAAAFTATPVTITSVSYNENTRIATVRLSGVLDKIQMGAIGTGANGIAESVRVGTDDQPIPFGNGLANAVCVTAAQTHVVATVALGDDVQRIAVGQTANAGQVIIDAGADGICQTTAAAVTEVQNIAVGRGLANQIEITAGVGFTLQSTPAGDDQLTDAPVFITVTANDIAGNSLNSKNNAIRTDGVIE